MNDIIGGIAAGTTLTAAVASQVAGQTAKQIVRKSPLIAVPAAIYWIGDIIDRDLGNHKGRKRYLGTF